MPALVSRSGRPVCMGLAVLLSSSACGRTDPLWWSDIYASDSGTEDHGTGDGDGDTVGTSSSTSTPGTSTTDTSDPDTGPDTTDTDPGTTDTDTSDTDPGTTETTESTSSETTDGCMDVPVGLSLVPPRVLLLLDQGSHMSLQFAGMTRWEAIGEALFGMQAGVVWSFESSVALGMLSYTSNNGDQGGQCPIAETVPIAVQSGGDMQFAFAGLNPADDNPTGDAITLALAQFGGEPGQLILLTGRNPDSCGNPANNAQAVTVAVAATEAAFAAGVSTRVVVVGDLNATVLSQLANAGAGLPPQLPNGAPYWTPQDVDALTADLDQILMDASSCALELEQALPPGAEQLCSLDLDGQPLLLDDADGWSLTAPDRVTLGGAACQALGQGATPTLICACEAFQP